MWLNWRLVIVPAALLSLGVVVPTQAGQGPQAKSTQSRQDRKRAKAEEKLEHRIAKEEEKLEREQGQQNIPYGYSGPQRSISPVTPSNRGRVEVQTLPVPDAQVFVDGGYAGMVQQHGSLTLPAGPHDIEIKTPSGKYLYDQHVVVLPGDKTRIFP